MKKKIMVLFTAIISITSFSQYDTSKYAYTLPGDTVKLFTTSDVNNILTYLKDKLVADKWFIVEDAVRQLYVSRVNEWVDKNKKPKPHK